MENAVDALIMATSVLLLIFALTIGISSFATLKVQVEDIVSLRDEIQESKSSTGDFLNYLKANSDLDVRTVKIDSIISAVKNVRKEQYTIYIVPKNGTIPNRWPSDLQTSAKDNTIYKDVKLVSLDQDIIMISNSGVQNKFFLDKDLYQDMISKLYQEYKDSTFKEYIGIYQNATISGVSEANKTTFKIITFVQTT